VPAWRREADALIANELGLQDVPWIRWGAALPPTGAPYTALVVSMVGRPAPSAERRPVLAELASRFAANGRLIVVDHNRPRRVAAALAAAARPPWVPGWSPAARWRRLAHPTAREVQGAGFCVDRLRLVAGERVQVVIATRV
jgi:hypothetical protein